MKQCMGLSVLGYLVLRRPEFNFDELGRGAFLPCAPKIDNLFYGGVDRMEWFDLDEDYYNESLPSRLIEIREKIFSPDNPPSDLNSCASIDDAREILSYSNKVKERNELIAISDENSFCSVDVDNVVVGAGSVVTKDILRLGIYAGNPARLIREL